MASRRGPFLASGPAPPSRQGHTVHAWRACLAVPPGATLLAPLGRWPGSSWRGIHMAFRKAQALGHQPPVRGGGSSDPVPLGSAQGRGLPDSWPGSVLTHHSKNETRARGKPENREAGLFLSSGGDANGAVMLKTGGPQRSHTESYHTAAVPLLGAHTGKMKTGVPAIHSQQPKGETAQRSIMANGLTNHETTCGI